MIFLSANEVTKAEYFLRQFLDIKQNTDMEFPIIHVYMYLQVVDGNELLERESSWIWIFHSMTFIVYLWVVSGDDFLVTQRTEIRIVPSMTLYVSLFIVPGDELFTTQSTLK